MPRCQVTFQRRHQTLEELAPLGLQLCRVQREQHAATDADAAVSSTTIIIVVDAVNTAARKSLEDPGVARRIADTGSLVVGNSPEDFARQIAAEFEVYRKVVADQKLKLDA